MLPLIEENQHTGLYELSGLSRVPLWHVLGYAVLLLEQGVLCALPILWAALLFSEAG